MRVAPYRGTTVYDPILIISMYCGGPPLFKMIFLMQRIRSKYAWTFVLNIVSIYASIRHCTILIKS